MNIVRYSIILRLRSEQFCLFIYLFFLFSVQLVLWHVSQRLMVGRRHGFDFSWLIYGVFNHVHLYLHINPAQKASQMFLVDVYILWHGLLTKSLIPLESLFISLYICKENEKLAKSFLPMSRVLFCYWLLFELLAPHVLTITCLIGAWLSAPVSMGSNEISPIAVGS